MDNSSIENIINKQIPSFRDWLKLESIEMKESDILVCEDYINKWKLRGESNVKR